MDSTTARLASYAAGLSFASLPEQTIRAAKRHLVDGIACLLGGFDAEPAAIARKLAGHASGTPPARVLGTGAPSSIEMATFANTVMLRYLDYNDTYVAVGSGHPSDMVPACLAVADAHDCDGRQVLTAIVAAYDVFGALADRVALRARGWDQGVFVVLGAAAGAGCLLGLSERQMGDALAIAVTSSIPTRQTRAGELAMWKGCATAAAARAGVFAALLAKEGMTGPTAAFEGFNGVWELVTGKFDLDSLGDPARGHAIERTNMKFFPSEYHSQAPMWMALNLRQRIRVEDIAAIRVQTYHIAYSEIGSEPEKWNPQTRETADHSLPFLLALALMDGTIGADSFSTARMTDPATHALMQKIQISENEAFTRRFPAELTTEIVVETLSGERHVETASYPRGHARNPMSDAEIEHKFVALAQPVLAPSRRDALAAALWDIDRGGPIDAVLQLVQVDR